MASSGSFNSAGYNVSDGSCYLTFSWTEKSQSIENNTTEISWTLKGGGTTSQWVKGRNFKLTIDGKTVYSFGGGANTYVSIKNGGVIASGTYTFTHNTDGTRSFNAYVEAGIYVWAVNCTGSKTFTLDTIPRTSSFTVSNASVDMGTAVTFNITRAATSFTHTLTLTWGNTVSTIGTGIATSKSWTIPLSLANDLPSSTSSGCTITCITYSGSTEIGRKTLAMTLKVPSSIKPSISGVTISEAVSGLASKFGAYIQNKSKLKVVTSASGSYSSTIKSYSTKILGKTYSGGTITSNVLDSSGSVSVAVTVTDSRGRTATTTKTVTVTPYSDPTISIFTAQRCNSDGTLNDDGEYVKLSIAFDITSLSSKNDKSYTVAYKLKEDADFTTLTSGSVYSLNTTYIPTVTFSGDNSYDFILTVTDYFRPVSHIDEIQTAFTLTDYHSSGTGISFGKVSEKENTFENALELRQIANSYAFQPSAFEGEKGYTLLAVIKLNTLNVNAPIVFEINRRGALCPMRVYVRFASSSTSTDPDLGSITYEGDNYGAFLIKTATSTWSLYVDNTSGWSNPCLQKWYTTNNQMSRIAVTFPQEQIETLPTPWYRATPVIPRSILDSFFPVGTIIHRYDHNDPNAMYPGTTWVRITNRFLWACDANGDIGTVGGEKTHTLTVAELPSHNHVISAAHEPTGNTILPEGTFLYRNKGDASNYFGAIASRSTGSGTAHNNMPPYVQISVWRRTA